MKRKAFCIILVFLMLASFSECLVVLQDKNTEEYSAQRVVSEETLNGNLLEWQADSGSEIVLVYLHNYFHGTACSNLCFTPKEKEPAEKLFTEEEVLEMISES